MLYSSSDPVPDALATDTNANAYPPFTVVDSTVVQRIMTELDSLEAKEEEGLCRLSFVAVDSYNVSTLCVGRRPRKGPLL